MGAEDFSFFGHAGVPASFAFLGSGNAATGAVHGLHTPQVQLKRLDFIHAAMPTTRWLSSSQSACAMRAWINCHGLPSPAFLSSGSAAAALQAACSIYIVR